MPSAASDSTVSSPFVANKSSSLSLRVPKFVRDKIRLLKTSQHSDDWPLLWRQAARLHWRILRSHCDGEKLIYRRGVVEFEFRPSLDDFKQSYLDQEIEEQLQLDGVGSFEESESYRFGQKSDIPKGWLSEIAEILKQVDPKRAKRRVGHARQAALAYYCQHAMYVQKGFSLVISGKLVDLALQLNWEVKSSQATPGDSQPDGASEKAAYECLYLFDSNRYARDADACAEAVQNAITALGGEILVSRLWAEQRLAYPINGHQKGTYWLIYFTLDSLRLTELDRTCQLNESLLRWLFTPIDPRLVEALVAHATDFCHLSSDMDPDEASSYFPCDDEDPRSDDRYANLIAAGSNSPNDHTNAPSYMI